jgi:hypothetical protein
LRLHNSWSSNILLLYQAVWLHWGSLMKQNAKSAHNYAHMRWNKLHSAMQRHASYWM